MMQYEINHSFVQIHDIMPAKNSCSYKNVFVQSKHSTWTPSSVATATDSDDDDDDDDDAADTGLSESVSAAGQPRHSDVTIQSSDVH